jgi:Ca-activated chloride channel homolog
VRRRSVRAFIAIGAVVGVLAVTAIALRSVAADARGCGSGLRLVVAASPDVAPAVQDVAARWERTGPKVKDQCVRVRVDAANPADVANSLAVRAGATINVAASPMPTPNEADVPTVWIPDSSAWISRVQAISKDAFDETVAAVATSPIVLAMPEAAVRAVRGSGSARLTAADLGRFLVRAQTDPTLRLGVVEPRRDTAGLAGARLLYEIVATSQAQLPRLVGVYRQLAVAPDLDGLVKSFGKVTMAPMSEQAVLSLDNDAPSSALAAVPLDGLGMLDFPYATLADKPRGLVRAAELFRGALLDPTYREAFSRRGFRARDGTAGIGFPTGHGVSADRVVGRALADARAVLNVLKVWDLSVHPSRLLTLIDVTASMNQPMVASSGQPISRIAMVRQIFASATNLFATDSEAGVWYFAGGLSAGQDFKEALPVAPLSEAQRAEITKAYSAAQPVASNVCPLYEAILAAYKKMRDSYRPGAGNTVVVFTDGTNDKPGMNIAQLLRGFEMLADVTRPVKIVILALGSDVNMGELTRIANAAGGPAFHVTGPEETAGILARALLGA